MKMKKRLLSILLSLVLMLGLMPGMGLTAYAATDTYTTLMNNVTVVKFNNYDWYIIEDNSTSATEGTVTLLAANYAFGVSTFSDSSSNAYSSSKIKTALDAYTTTGAFKNVASAIVDTNLDDVSVKGAKLYLLNTSEAKKLNSTILNYSFPGSYINGGWWLRFPSYGTKRVAYVNGNNGSVDDVKESVEKELGVRPALKLDLSSSKNLNLVPILLS